MLAIIVFGHKRALQDMERWKNMPITLQFQINKYVHVDVFENNSK